MFLASATLVSLVLLAAVGLWRNASAESRWIEQSVDGMRYDVLLPRAFAPAQPYPVVLYLHQLAMGTNPTALHREIDPWFEGEAFRLRHKAIVVVPMLDQSDDPGGKTVNFGGKRAGGAAGQAAVAAVEQVMQRYRVDPARIYLTGNSMGGMGVWALLLDYNSRTGTRGHVFAAGMPLAGRHATADPEAAAAALRTVPIWAIHGRQDHEVSPDWDRTMARLLPAGAAFRYTEDPALGHDVWDTYYRQSRVWDWLFGQSGPPAAAE